MPPTPYSWLPLATAVQQIQDRLNDGGVFWSVAEVQGYLLEGLRLLNALTESWKAEFTFTAAGSVWQNLGLITDSPRLRTVTDAQLCTQMEYMLLEPAVGIGSWTGTNQFDVEKLQTALSVRRNEVIQVAGCNTVNLAPINTTPGTRRTALADTVLEIRRIRFLQTFNSGVVISYMKRSDTQAFHYFNSDYLQDVGTPIQWSVASEPPLSFDVDVAPNTPGQYDVLVLQSGPQFGTNPSLLGMPDDWSFIPMYGALADLLSEETESTDRQRAEYCAKRYQDGLDMMRKSNWFVQALIGGAVADTPSLEKKDRWSIGWQENTGAIPAVVTDGIDAFNVSPPGSNSVLLTVVQNAPFLDPTNAFVQVARDDWDQVLNYIQHIASFKMGGAEFFATLGLLDEFFEYCQRKNKRTTTYGLYVDVLNTAGQKQDKEQPR
jgi:hypothetical protein